MIAILVMMYMFLKYVLEMGKEDLLKFMLALSLVNLLPAVIYFIYTLMYGGFNPMVLLLMAVV